MRFRFIAAVLCTGLALSPLVCAAATPPRSGEFLAVSQIRRGMKGYGLTVFRGTKIERFEVTVVDVVRKGSLVVPGHDMILVRVHGGPLTSRGAYAIHGMSGSPVYVGGKLIGAYSQAEPMTKEPLAGVTPIADMLEAWDPKLPTSPSVSLPGRTPTTVALRQPLHVGSRRISRLVLNESPFSARRSSGSTAVLQRCASVLPVAGMSAANRERLARILRPYDVKLVQGGAGGSMPDLKGTAMVPGAAVGMMLVAGDIPVAATGTLTYRRGNRILAFGHPFLGAGPIEAPLCTAYVHDVWPLLTGSYKLSSPGRVIGASAQDRPFAISGVLGKNPLTIPVTVDVRDKSTGRAKRYVSQVVSHPALTGALVSLATSLDVADLRDLPIPTMARVQTSVDAEEIGRIDRTNTAFSAAYIDQAVTADLDEIAGMLSSNPFYPLAIKGVNIRAEIETGRRTATIQRVFLREGRLAPGDTADVGVVIKPYRKPAVTTSLKVRIPLSAPSGKLMLEVRGGAAPAAISLGGMMFRVSGPSSAEQAPPVSTQQMVKRFLEREKSNEIVARLVLPTTAVSVDGEPMRGLPPSLDAIMRSAKSSAVQLDRDEVKTVLSTEWVVSGRQALAVTVQRRDLREAPAGPTQPGVQPPTAPMPMPVPDPGILTDMPMGDDIDLTGALSPDADAALAAKPTRVPGPARQPAATPAAPPAVEAPASPSPAASADKTVVRGPQVWKQSTKADFDKGETHSACVTSAGTIALAPSLERLASSPESFAWSLVPAAGGKLYVGTGTQGRILVVGASGESKEFCRLPEAAVHGLLNCPDGALLAATGPNGRVYRVSADGKAEVLYKAPERYVLALARGPSGDVYAGTGGGSGRIYRIGTDGKAALFAAMPEEHVLCLAVDGSGNVLAGTAPSGLVYRITPAGAVSVLYDCVEQSVTGVGVTSAGVVYACTGPKGVLYRIAPDGTARALTDRPLPAFTALTVGPAETVFATSGSTVYTVGGTDDVLRTLERNTGVDLLSVAVRPDGMVYAGAGNTADIYTAAPSLGGGNGTYESVAHDAKTLARWGALRWVADVPAGTQVRFETRSGNSAEPGDSWSPWAIVAPRGPGEGRITSPAARFIQYRVTLTGAGAAASPVVRSVAVSLLPKNQAPKVTVQAPTGGERWSGQQTIRWAGTDPTSDTLSYEVFYSADSGANWLPLPRPEAPRAPSAPAKPAPAAAKPAPSVPAKSGPATPATKAPSVAEVTGILDRHPNIPTALRDAIMKRAEEVNTAQSAGDNAPVADVTPAVVDPVNVIPTGKETSRPLDTSKLKDGVYRVKVVASDRPANADDPQSATVVSEPFTVCNAAPILVIEKASVKVAPDRTVTVSGVAFHKTVSITAVQFRVDDGQWLAASSSDALFDSDLEGFTVRTAPLAAGKHTVEIKAYQAGGVTATEKVPVEVK